MLCELNEFIYESELRGLSSKTIKSYRNMNLAFINYVKTEFKIDDVDEIKKIHIKKYLRTKLEQGRKDKYINSIIKVLRAFFSYLVDESYIDDNPIENVKFVREEKRIIETYTDKEVKKLINFYCDQDFLSVRNKTIIALQIDTGIRCTETLDIAIEDLLDDRMLIHGKGRKQRLVGISPPMKKILRKYIRVKKQYFDNKKIEDSLFLSRTGRRLTVEAVERIYKVAKEEAGITRKIRVSPHTSRHTFAVEMLANNDIYTVSKLLGHANISITQVYLQSLTNEKLIDRQNIRSPLQTIK